MIQFKQLSNPLKIGIILAYGIASIYLAAFLIGMAIGIARSI
jgi:hypothetical protein